MQAGRAAGAGLPPPSRASFRTATDIDELVPSAQPPALFADTVGHAYHLGGAGSLGPGDPTTRPRASPWRGEPVGSGVLPRRLSAATFIIARPKRVVRLASDVPPHLPAASHRMTREAATALPSTATARSPRQQGLPRGPRMVDGERGFLSEPRWSRRSRTAGPGLRRSHAILMTSAEAARRSRG
jgi:hypothetical protein